MMLSGLKTKFDLVDMRILVVGGAGAFGSFYAKLFADHGFKVCISDPDAHSGKILCHKNSFEWVESTDTAKDFDIVVVAVPNEVAPSVVKSIGKNLSKGTLLLDLCSVKHDVVKELEKLSKKDLELASLHPMHGPRVRNISGYPVVCIPIKRGKKLDALKDFFEKAGVDFFFSSAEEHDRLLSIVQGLTHYSQFISAAVLKELEDDLKDTLKFATPNYHLFLSLMSRVILQNPELYAQIQLSNPVNKEIWAAFKNKADEFEKLCLKGDSKALEKKIIDSAQQFKEEDSFLLDSDRAVNAISHMVDHIKKHMGKRFMVENILTGKFHYGVIEGINNNILVLNEQGKKIRISLQHSRFTSKDEMQTWRRQNLKEEHLDYSFLVPVECDKEIVTQCLSHIKTGKVSLLDEYESEKLPEGKKSLTIRVDFFSDEAAEEIDRNMRRALNGLGFHSR